MQMKDFDLKGKLALVTGASRGIGYALSLELAKRGAHVIAVARNKKDLEKLDDAINAMGQSCTLVPMDLHDMQKIDALGEKIHERWGKLDILVANAGILGTLSPVDHIEASVFEEVMQINLTSQWRLIRSVAPLLHCASAGRVIVLSSGVAHTARAFWGAYAASKAALEVLVRCWAHETEKSNLRINLVNPGATRTDMRAAAMPGEDPMTLPSANAVAASIMALTSPHLQETGQLFDCRKKRFTSYQLPE